MLKNKKISTRYAPAERLSEEEVKQQAQVFRNYEALDEVLGKIPAIFIIVNKFRQIVYMNKGALEFTGLDEVASAIGQRPGELLDCIHAHEEEGGCGTSEACSYCGAVNAVLSSQKGVVSVHEGRLILGSEENAYDLRIYAAPLIIGSETFSAITMQDIRHEKRRLTMEQIFFHDILNTTTALLGNLELSKKLGKKRNPFEFIDRAITVTNKLIEEIQSQRILTDIENKTYDANINTFKSIDLLKEVINIYQNGDISKEKTIKIDKSAISIQIASDKILLHRVLSNMIKNALEATEAGGIITIGCDLFEDSIEFWVHNPGFIPREVQLQIFHRSFSTKSINRGLGTYSVKLLTKFLKGEVSFTTSEDNGTTFKARYPVNL